MTIFRTQRPQIKNNYHTRLICFQMKSKTIENEKKNYKERQNIGRDRVQRVITFFGSTFNDLSKSLVFVLDHHFRNGWIWTVNWAARHSSFSSRTMTQRNTRSNTLLWQNHEDLICNFWTGIGKIVLSGLWKISHSKRTGHLWLNELSMVT